MARGRPLDPASLERHLDRLMRAALALCGNRPDAEDLVQETCARVLARPRRVTGAQELPYLLQALRNTFANELRARSRRPSGAELADDVPATSPGVAEAVELRAVWAVISSLPDDQRDAVVAVDVVGLSYAEAGRALGGVKEATVATRVFRGRSRVADALRDVTPTATRRPGGGASSG